MISDLTRHGESPISQPNLSVSRLKIKICGLTTVEDALFCAQLGADWIGINFHPASPRCVSLDRARMIVEVLPNDCEPVGLFVDRPIAEIREIVERTGIRILQLHGRETPEDLVELSEFCLIRAYRIGSPIAIAQMVAELERCLALGRSPDAVLIDAYVEGRAGGTGHSISSELLDQIPSLPQLILAGGLTAENVAERVAYVRPWMIDTASGVEFSPGHKDREKVARFIKNARAAKIEG